MSKSIIICCDGTWNKPESEQDIKSTPTNVLKLVRGIIPRVEGRDQMVYYDEGIGAGGFWDKWVNGALGGGISKNIIDAYRFLVNNWAEEDKIYLFGFSRGAYTVRSLAGLIDLFGLLPKTALKHFPITYKYYRTPPHEREELEESEQAKHLLREVDAAGRHVSIHFIGVWDTVGSLGLPVRGLRTLSKSWVGFHDTQLGESVRFAAQALAIDELRKPFEAELWTHAKDADDQQKAADNARILQVWMPGVHSDVGGGYYQQELSDLALEFIVKQANRHGLEVNEDSLYSTKEANRINGKLHDSYGHLYRLMGPNFRAIGPAQRTERGMDIAVSERIHEAAPERLESEHPFHNARSLTAALQTQTPIFYERHEIRSIVPESKSQGAILNTGEQCKVIDFSKHGARIRCNRAFRDGDRLQLNLPFLGGEMETVVKWHKGKDVGVRFAA